MLAIIVGIFGGLGMLLGGWGMYNANNAPNGIFPHGTVEEGDFGTGLDD